MFISLIDLDDLNPQSKTYYFSVEVIDPTIIEGLQKEDKLSLQVVSKEDTVKVTITELSTEVYFDV